MTDTNTTPTPNETISENHDLLWKLINTFNQHVTELVDKRVDAILASHAAMKIIDESVERKLRDIAQDMLDEHDSDNDHPTNDDISDMIATHVNHIDFTDNIRRSVEEILSDGDYCTEERAQELAQDAIYDIDWTDKVKEGLRGMCE